jgi:hypothetical protein
MGAEGNVDHSQVTEITLLSPLGQPWGGGGVGNLTTLLLIFSPIYGPLPVSRGQCT